MKKIFYSLIYLFAYLFILPTSVLAAGEFSADYEVDYTIAPDGRTIVTQNISLTNKLTNLYPTKYSILIDTEKIKNVVAYDRKGVITPTINQKDGKTEIILSFNDQVVGVGNKLHFTLRFENGDIAQKNGSIWEVNIPGVTSDSDIAAYSVSLQVPQTFGPNAYMSPPPADGRRWTKEQMIKGGVSAAYGEMQAFSLDLSYFLQNTRVTGGIGEIALPPDTAFQKVVINAIEPKPAAVRQDDDGNWIAQYSLAPGQKLDITATATIFISLAPRSAFGKVNLRPTDYTRPLKFWNADDPRIVSLASELRTPKAIYDYVVKTLSYDYNRVNDNPIRKGAASALSTPKNSICMEFTDLFIALARAAGIPAREIVGYAYTTNSRLRPLSLVADVLHAWPEYYDSEKQTWIPVDPTWANTTGGVNYFDKLDFNHITFAIHGFSSELPYAAGFYKRSGKNTKDVMVRFAQGSFTFLPTAKLTPGFSLPKVFPAGFTTSGQVIIENTSGVAAEDVDVAIETSFSQFSFKKRIAQIPPFGKFFIPVSFPIDNYLRSEKGVITATVNGEVINNYIDIQPALTLFAPFAIGILLLGIGFWYLLVKKPLWTLFRH